MKTFLFIAMAVASLCGSLPVPQMASDSDKLEAALKKMDTAAASFRSTQADFEWDHYQKVVDDTEVKKGTIYFRRSGQQIEMMARLTDPDQYVLYKDGKLQVYEPKIEQLIVHDAGNNRSEMESFLVLGFGGSGQDLKKQFDVTYGGDDIVDGVACGKLLLVSKTEKVRNTFSQFILWIDLSRGISVQQKFITPQQDYRLAKYSHIRINEKIANDVFQIKTSGKTQIITR